MSSSSLDYLELCRLCLEKDRAQVPIFGEGEVSQIFLKIHACLPVKVSSDDKLPKKICDGCFNKVNDFYSYWNTTANAEKQLLQWLNQMEGLEDKQGYVTEVLDSNVMKQEQSSDSRLDGSVMQVSGHQNMDINMIENMSIITMPAGSEQQFTTVPIDTGGIVQTVQVSGPSTQIAHDQTHLQEVEVDEDEDNMDDGCDNDDGLPVKEETDEGDQSLEQRYVTLPCDEAGPSGLQQQKIPEMSEITIQQTADGDPKSGPKLKPSILKHKRDLPTLKSVDKTSMILTTKNNLQSLLKSLKKESKTSIAIISSDESSLDSKQTLDNFEEYISPCDRSAVYQCDSCDEAFEDHSSLVAHKSDRYECDSCDETFRDRSSLIIHKTERSIVRTRAALRGPVDNFQCDMCKRQFSTKGVLERHHKNCGVIDLNELPTNLRQPRKPKKPRVAGEQSVRPPELPAECDKCNKVFKKDKYLRVHMAMAHGEHVICQVCNEQFNTMALLKSHMQDNHSGDFTEFCHICGKGFFLRQSLKVHLAAHDRDNNPAVCEICQKSFRHEVYLKKHVQQVHVELKDRKKYQCEYCGYETHYKTCFTEHMYKHTGEGQVECQVCKKHVRKAYMRTHMRIHTGEKPEVCEYCGKAFSARKYLTKHLITHTGEKPFECRICHKKYTQRGTLTLHIRKHHPGEVTDTRPWKVKKESVPTTEEVERENEEVEEEEQQKLMDDENVDALVEEEEHLIEDGQVIIDEHGAIIEIVKHSDNEEPMELEVLQEEEPIFEEFVEHEEVEN